MADSPQNAVTGSGSNEIRATGPGGWGITIRGRETALLQILAAAFASIVWVNAKGFIRLEQMGAEAGAVRAIDVEKIARDHREVLCILALDREELKRAIRSGDVCDYLFGTGTRSRR